MILKRSPRCQSVEHPPFPLSLSLPLSWEPAMNTEITSPPLPHQKLEKAKKTNIDDSFVIARFQSAESLPWILKSLLHHFPTSTHTLASKTKSITACQACVKPDFMSPHHWVENFSLKISWASHRSFTHVSHISEFHYFLHHPRACPTNKDHSPH